MLCGPWRKCRLIQGQDYLYLTPYIKEIEAETRERGDLEAMVVNKRKQNKS